MNLESVRELKSQFAAKSIVEGAVGAVHSLAVSAQSLVSLSQPQRTFALGIAPMGGAKFKLAVRVQRRSLEAGAVLAEIKRRAKGELDVRFVGRIFKRAKWHQKLCRPLRIGCSIGHFKITAGTLGCFVKSRKDGSIQILSNNHVLANENDAATGDAILQPGAFDGGTRTKHTIGALGRFVKLKPNGSNTVDAALATIKPSIKFDATLIKGLGKLAGLGPEILDEGALVHKLGRTTGLTRGRVTAFELDNVVVGYDMGNVRFDNQIEIEGADAVSFSQGGDSGSLVVDEDLRGVALLFAGGEVGGANGLGLTYASPVRAALDALKVDLV